MAITTTTFEEQLATKYTRILERQLQEDNSILDRYVTIVPGCTGKEVDLPVTDKAVMDRITSPYQDIEDHQVQKFGNLKMYPVGFYGKYKFTNDSSTYSTNVDYAVSNIIVECRAEANRKKDEVILGVHYDKERGLYVPNMNQPVPDNPYDDKSQPGGLFGTAHYGLRGQVLSDLDATNIINADYADTGVFEESNITLDKLRRAVGNLKRCHALVPGRTHGVIVISQSQVDAILQQPEFISTDFGMIASLKDGTLSRILGCEVLQTEMLPYDENGHRMCAVYVKEHLKFGMWKDLSVRIDPVVQKGVNYGQVIPRVDFGSVRMHKESVQVIKCAE